MPSAEKSFSGSADVPWKSSTAMSRCGSFEPSMSSSTCPAFSAALSSCVRRSFHVTVDSPAPAGTGSPAAQAGPPGEYAVGVLGQDGFQARYTVHEDQPVRVNRIDEIQYRPRCNDRHPLPRHLAIERQVQLCRRYRSFALIEHLHV